MSDFDKLMGELQQLSTDQAELAKALPADDGKDEQKIQAAAAEGGLGGDGDEDDKGGKPDGDADDAPGAAPGKPMTKSFSFTLDDGTVVEAEDGTELVKSLTEKVGGIENNLAKAMGSMMELMKGQSEMIKSLSDRVAKLSGEGRGRKAVVSVHEKPAATPNTDTMAKAMGAGDGLTPDQFFAKAFEAQREGRINGADIAMAEACLNKGMSIPDGIVKRVMQ